MVWGRGFLLSWLLRSQTQAWARARIYLQNLGDRVEQETEIRTFCLIESECRIGVCMLVSRASVSIEMRDAVKLWGNVSLLNRSEKQKLQIMSVNGLTMVNTVICSCRTAFGFTVANLFYIFTYDLKSDSILICHSVTRGNDFYKRVSEYTVLSPPKQTHVTFTLTYFKVAYFILNQDSRLFWKINF